MLRAHHRVVGPAAARAVRGRRARRPGHRRLVGQHPHVRILLVPRRVGVRHRGHPARARFLARRARVEPAREGLSSVALDGRRGVRRSQHGRWSDLSLPHLADLYDELVLAVGRSSSCRHHVLDDAAEDHLGLGRHLPQRWRPTSASERVGRERHDHGDREREHDGAREERSAVRGDRGMTLARDGRRASVGSRHVIGPSSRNVARGSIRVT